MYKNTQHYRHTVHRYLDSIWKVSSRRGKARSTMYSWLSTQMDLPEEETHVAKFTRNQCKQAIKILKPKYIELFGKDLSYKKKNKMVNDPILIKELIEKLDTIPEDIIKKNIEVIKNNLELFSENDIEVMIRDIESAWDLGDECDKKEWLELLKVLKDRRDG